jgi:oligoendopeptidase F
MTKIKQDLLEVVEAAMIPEVEAYIEDLHKIIEKKEQIDETMDEVREMESFLVELQNIIYAVNENKIDDEQAQEIYEKIEKLIEEHSEEK